MRLDCLAESTVRRVYGLGTAEWLLLTMAAQGFTAAQIVSNGGNDGLMEHFRNTRLMAKKIRKLAGGLDKQMRLQPHAELVWVLADVLRMRVAEVRFALSVSRAEQPF